MRHSNFIIICNKNNVVVEKGLNNKIIKVHTGFQ